LRKRPPRSPQRRSLRKKIPKKKILRKAILKTAGLAKTTRLRIPRLNLNMTSPKTMALKATIAPRKVRSKL